VSVTARFITPHAQTLIAQSAAWRVLSAHSHVINFINESNDVLSVVDSKALLCPFCVVVDLLRDVADPQDIEISAHTQTWQPRLPVTESHPDKDIYNYALQLAPRDSLIDIFREAHSPLIDRVREGASLLRDGIVAVNESECLQGAELLAGLGGGLTPAGDDFVCGVFLWAHITHRGHALLLRAADAIAPKTTILSAAFVRAAARGECMMVWHSFIDALTSTPRDMRNLLRATDAILKIGHTSGADALAGFLYGFFTHTHTTTKGERVS
jgi:hypothetical protein